MRTTQSPIDHAQEFPLPGNLPTSKPAVNQSHSGRHAMKAAFITATGSPDQFQVASLPDPVAASGEVIVQAKYHKLHEILGQRDQEIADLEARLKSIKSLLRQS